MKKATLLFISVLLSMLIAGNASAISYTFNDDYANWPGWPKSPNPVNTADQIGEFPIITSVTVNSEGGFLQSIAVSISNMRSTETLFINKSYAPGESYEAWDYYAAFGSSPQFFTVAADYEYTLVPDKSVWRVGHPWGIADADLEETFGFLKEVTYDGALLTYVFFDEKIALGEKFVIGMSVDCGNDVFLTPVPEPSIMLLLGAGLLGLAAIRRKK